MLWKPRYHRRCAVIETRCALKGGKKRKKGCRPQRSSKERDRERVGFVRKGGSNLSRFKVPPVVARVVGEGEGDRNREMGLLFAGESPFLDSNSARHVCPRDKWRDTRTLSFSLSLSFLPSFFSIFRPSTLSSPPPLYTFDDILK